MLRHGFDMPAQATAIERAVDAVLERGMRTPDLATGAATESPADTAAITDSVLAELRSG
jgi:3-isopropylmalate dehydrogenase